MTADPARVALVDEERRALAAVTDAAALAELAAGAPRWVLLAAGLAALDAAGGYALGAASAPAVEEAVRARVGPLLSSAGLRIADGARATADDVAAEQGAVRFRALDGAAAFEAGLPTAATTLSLWSGGAVIAAALANPATGEVLSCDAGGGRLLQAAALGGEPASASLPLAPNGPASLLLRVGGGRAAAGLVSSAMAAWSGGDVRMVTTAGGSMAWAIADCARGRFTYVDPGAGARAEETDVAAGVALLRAAGGDVVDLQGAPVDPSAHEGPLVAGIDAASRDTVRALVSQVP
jgi:fructose-1,6-bisphosphatase/inositol monophosphatase family enzyme